MRLKLWIMGICLSWLLGFDLSSCTFDLFLDYILRGVALTGGGMEQVKDVFQRSWFDWSLRLHRQRCLIFFLIGYH